MSYRVSFVGILYKNYNVIWLYFDLYILCGILQVEHDDLTRDADGNVTCKSCVGITVVVVNYGISNTIVLEIP